MSLDEVLEANCEEDEGYEGRLKEERESVRWRWIS